jgi:hypothetical protein
MSVLQRLISSVVLASVLSFLGLVTACRDVSPPPDSITASPAPATASQASRTVAGRLRIAGTQFITPDGSAFQWRGITAFRLVDYVADGQEDLTAKYLAWAAGQGVTVVRVLTMMGGQFDLRPEDGRRALPRVLELAAKHGVYVEVVAFAGTADIPVDLQQHIDGIASILATHPNGILEIANEPVHPSQSAEVQNPAVLKALAARVPSDIPVALGSIERGDGFGDGKYITWHSPRESGRGGWSHVHALVEGAALLARWKKPVISDEPIGAGPAFQPGRRDDAPARFRAAALLTRLLGLGATFHYEAGLQARAPEGRELDCFNAWGEAWALLPADVERHGTFRVAGAAGSIVAAYDRERVLGIYERADDAAGWVLVLGEASPAVTLSNGWSVRETREIDGGRLLSVTRSKGESRTGS